MRPSKRELIRRIETLESEARGYTDQITDARIAAAEGADVDVSGLAVREIVAGLYGRAFAQAEVTDVPVRLSEDTLALVGRSLAVRGEIVLYPEGQEWMPAADWDVSGTHCDPLTWRYRLTTATPNGSKGKSKPALDVLHVRINTTPERPWEGRSPFAVAKDTAKLTARAEGALCDEMNTPVGGIVPVPSTLAQATKDSLSNKIRALKGRLLPLESQHDGLSNATGQQGRDYSAVRFKPEADAATVTTWTEAQQAMLAACGVPVELAHHADGAPTREAWRRFLHGTLDPLGRVLAAELRRKLSGSPRVSFDRLFASDLSGRARAFQSMVGGGMPLQQAAILSGLTNVD